MVVVPQLFEYPYDEHWAAVRAQLYRDVMPVSSASSEGRVPESRLPYIPLRRRGARRWALVARGQRGRAASERGRCDASAIAPSHGRGGAAFPPPLPLPRAAGARPRPAAASRHALRRACPDVRSPPYALASAAHNWYSRESLPICGGIDPECIKYGIYVE